MRITAIKQQVKRTDRYSVYIDSEYSFSLSESALLESRIASGQEIGKPTLEAFKKLSAEDKAYQNALRYAAGRLHSEWELRTYLRRKEIDGPAADGVVAKLQRIGLIDDEVFARSWVENRRLLKPTSRRKLLLELRQKHVSEAIVEMALAEAGDTDDRTALRTIAEKKWRLIRYQADPNKLMQYLARQGFGYDDIKSVVEELRAAQG